MKKLFYSLFALAMTVMTFTSCEDVPMPYDDPNKNPGGAETEESVEPAGSGTAEDPYNVAAIIELVQGMEAGVESTQDYYFKGKISAITEEYSSQYGNGTFYISDDGNNSSTRFYVFRALYLNNKRFADGNEQIKIGDEVVICGKVTNYNGNTPETAQGKAYLYSLNGQGGGGGSATGIEVTCAKAVELTNALADNATSSETYSVTGYITEVVGSVSKNQQTFWMADTKDGGKVFEAYWANLPDGVSEFKAGSKVKITGNLTKYVNANTGNVTAEMKNPDVEILEDGGGGGQSGSAKGTGTLSDPYNAVAAADAVKNLSWTSNTEYEKTGEVYVKGKISRIASNGTFGQSGDYGNASFYISDDGSENNEFYVFRTLYLGNVKYTSGTDIKVGDEVIICGKLMNYKGNTPETVANETYIYSLNGQGGGGGGQETPSGLGTYEKPLSFAEAQKADNSEKPWAWVKAVIVGYVTGQVYATGATFGAEGCESKTNILISDTPNVNDPEKCMPVQLPSGALRNGLNLQENPNLVGKEIIIYGQLDKYFSVPGIKSPKYAEAGGNSFGTKP